MAPTTRSRSKSLSVPPTTPATRCTNLPLAQLPVVAEESSPISKPSPPPLLVEPSPTTLIPDLDPTNSHSDSVNVSPPIQSEPLTCLGAHDTSEPGNQINTSADKNTIVSVATETITDTTPTPPLTTASDIRHETTSDAIELSKSVSIADTTPTSPLTTASDISHAAASDIRHDTTSDSDAIELSKSVSIADTTTASDISHAAASDIRHETTSDSDAIELSKSVSDTAVLDEEPDGQLPTETPALVDDSSFPCTPPFTDYFQFDWGADENNTGSVEHLPDWTSENVTPSATTYSQSPPTEQAHLPCDTANSPSATQNPVFENPEITPGASDIPESASDIPASDQNTEEVMNPFTSPEAKKRAEFEANSQDFVRVIKQFEQLGCLSTWNSDAQKAEPYYLPAELVGNRVSSIPDCRLQPYCIEHKCQAKCRCGRAVKICAPPKLNLDNPDNPRVYVMVCDAPPGFPKCGMHYHLTRFREQHTTDPIYTLRNPLNVEYPVADNQLIPDDEGVALGFDMTRPNMKPCATSTSPRRHSSSSTPQITPRKSASASGTSKMTAKTPSPRNSGPTAVPKELLNPTYSPDAFIPMDNNTLFTPTPSRAVKKVSPMTSVTQKSSNLATPTPPRNVLKGQGSVSRPSSLSQPTSSKSIKRPIDEIDITDSDSDSDEPARTQPRKKARKIVTSDEEYTPPPPEPTQPRQKTRQVTAVTESDEEDTVSPPVRKKARRVVNSKQPAPKRSKDKAASRASDIKPFPTLPPLNSSPLPPPSQVMQAYAKKIDNVVIKQEKTTQNSERPASPDSSAISISSDSEPEGKQLSARSRVPFGRTPSTAFDLTGDEPSSSKPKPRPVIKRPKVEKPVIMVRDTQSTTNKGKGKAEAPSKGKGKAEAPSKGKGKAEAPSRPSQPTFKPVPPGIFLDASKAVAQKLANRSAHSDQRASGSSSALAGPKRQVKYVETEPKKPKRVPNSDDDEPFPRGARFKFMAPNGYEKPISEDVVHQEFEEAVKDIRPAAYRFGITLEEMEAFLANFQQCDRCEMVYFMAGGIIHYCDE
ncbi:hypothetical protein VNI00_001019 [Paramarasmius palmivorus]|uniref:Uncharacterized protein n=1 Tax=Paramarasmius palmivorus TaxID=297713 RepID=A0AAW0E8T8_9AGAR